MSKSAPRIGPCGAKGAARPARPPEPDDKKSKYGIPGIRKRLLVERG
jgi:hypothetical protein